MPTSAQGFAQRAARRRVRRRATCRRRTRGDASAGNGGSRHVILELSECLRTRALLKFGRASHSAQRFLPDRHVLLCPHSAPPSPRRQLCCVYSLPHAKAYELRRLQGIPRSMISRSMNTKVNGAYFPPRVFLHKLTSLQARSLVLTWVRRTHVFPSWRARRRASLRTLRVHGQRHPWWRSPSTVSASSASPRSARPWSTLRTRSSPSSG